MSDYKCTVGGASAETVSGASSAAAESNEVANSCHNYYYSSRIMSSEIVEIEDDNMNTDICRDGGEDVYVAVGKDDLDVLKWAIDHLVSPGSTVFLLHVFSPITYINTPVGRLSKSQMSQEQLRVYKNEENNKRRSLLQKYIKMCNESNVGVDTILLESNVTTKAILDYIPILNIAKLVIGTKRPPSSRRLRKLGKSEVVKKNCPKYCEVSVVHEGKKVDDNPNVTMVTHAKPRTHRNLERFPFECVCFPTVSE